MNLEKGGNIGLNWVKVASYDVTTLEENKPTQVQAGEKNVGLIRRGDSVYAFAAKCPHAGAPMCEGWIDAMGRIVCPLHKYRFDPVNGRNTSGEGYKLFIYPVEIRNEEIWIGLVT